MLHQSKAREQRLADQPYDTLTRSFGTEPIRLTVGRQLMPHYGIVAEHYVLGTHGFEKSRPRITDIKLSFHYFFIHLHIWAHRTAHRVPTYLN
jgi:hypothetical protein